MKDLRSAKDILTQWARQLEERAQTSSQKRTDKNEERIQKLEKLAGASIYSENEGNYLIICALCEIARQLSRLGDIYEFEIGVLDDYEPNLRKPDPTTLSEIFRKEKNP